MTQSTGIGNGEGRRSLPEPAQDALGSRDARADRSARRHFAPSFKSVSTSLDAGLGEELDFEELLERVARRACRPLRRGYAGRAPQTADLRSIWRLLCECSRRLKSPTDCLTDDSTLPERRAAERPLLTALAATTSCPGLRGVRRAPLHPCSIELHRAGGIEDRPRAFARPSGPGGAYFAGGSDEGLTDRKERRPENLSRIIRSSGSSNESRPLSPRPGLGRAARDRREIVSRQSGHRLGRS